MGIPLRKLWQNKPKQYGPWKVVHRSLFHNLERMGIDPQVLRFSNLCWNPGNQIDYSKGLTGVNTGAVFSQNKLNFNTNDSIAFPASSVSDLSIGTIRASVKVLSDTVNSIIVGFAITSDSYINAGLIYRQSADSFGFFVRDSSTTYAEYKTIDSTVPKDIWHEVVVTQDGNGIEMFLNGVKQVVTDTVTPTNLGAFLNTLTGINSLAIGASLDATPSYSVADISLVEIYSNVLSDDKIVELYDNPWMSYRAVPQKTIFPPSAGGSTILPIYITTGIPVLGSPSIGQTHTLSSPDLVTGTPNLGDPSIGQTQTFSLQNLTAGIPTLGSPEIGQTHTLSPSILISGVPTLDIPSIGQTHTLIAPGISTGSPSLGLPAIGQPHTLTALGITTGTPVLGTPTISQDGFNNLTPVSIITGTPDIETPGLGQTHVLVADGIAAGVPALGSPVIGQGVSLTPEDITTVAPVLDTPSIGQTHTLTAFGITTGLPAIGTPLIWQTHTLTAGGITTGIPVLGSPALDFSTPETPPERIYSIPAENRIYAIESENRVYAIQ